MRWFHRSMIVWQPAWTSSNPRVCKRTICGKKDIQHLRFPCSPLPKYWSGPRVLNFAVRMGCGAFTLVWSYDNISVQLRYSCVKSAEKLEKKTNATTWDRTKDLSVNSRPLCQRSSGGMDQFVLLALDDYVRREKKKIHESFFTKRFTCLVFFFFFFFFFF